MGGAVWTKLSDRAVVAVGGSDARHLLQNLITCDLDEVGAGGAAYGALLTPQGKLQFDFIVFATGAEYLFDLPKSLATDFVRRLGLYRLRSAVEIEDRGETHEVVAIWGDDGAIANAVASAPDPRLPALGRRAIVTANTDLTAIGGEVDEKAYARHRIALGVPEGGADFAYGDAFPHDADLDQLGGVAFTKGCFVGQEVVSRMEHRGTARRRIIKVEAANALASGTDIVAGQQVIGSIGSVSGGSGLAMIRLDRAASAVESGQMVTAAGQSVDLTIPAWAGFGWPAPADGE